jgi:hypothetical protein
LHRAVGFEEFSSLEESSRPAVVSYTSWCIGLDNAWRGGARTHGILPLSLEDIRSNLQRPRSEELTAPRVCLACLTLPSRYRGSNQASSYCHTNSGLPSEATWWRACWVPSTSVDKELLSCSRGSSARFFPAATACRMQGNLTALRDRMLLSTCAEQEIANHSYHSMNFTEYVGRPMASSRPWHAAKDSYSVPPNSTCRHTLGEVLDN